MAAGSAMEATLDEFREEERYPVPRFGWHAVSLQHIFTSIIHRLQRTTQRRRVSEAQVGLEVTHCL